MGGIPPGLLGMMPRWPPELRSARGHVFSLLLGVYPAGEFLGHMETPGLTFGGAACLCSNVAASAGAPTSGEEGFHLPLPTPVTCPWRLAVPVGVAQLLTGVYVSICISPVTADLGRLFLCSLAACIPSWERCLVRSLAHF